MSRGCCAILDDYQHAALRMADWSQTGMEVVVHDRHYHTDAELIAAIDQCEVVVAMRERTPFDRARLERLPKLKLLLTTAPRNAAIDVGAAEALGITVCGTDWVPHPTAELTWALILALVRHVVREDRSIRDNGPWQSTVGFDLHGRTLGLLGLGNIGKQMARIGHVFGMQVIAWSNNLTAAQCDAVGVEHVTKPALVERSDILSIHTQLSRRTEGLIDTPEFERMKRTAFLINTSRGFIVREQALIDALERGLIAGAALDVYEQEPLPADHPLRRAPNTVLTPHVGYVSEDNYRLWYRQSVENILAWQRGEPIRRVDPARNFNRAL